MRRPITSPPELAARVTGRLVTISFDLLVLSERLCQAGWEDSQLEDLRTAIALLQQATDLLRRHARRWRETP